MLGSVCFKTFVMKIIIVSTDRPDYQLTVQNIPEHLRSSVVMYIPERQLDAYSRNPVLKSVTFKVWPDGGPIDCIPRKRAWFYSTIKSDHLVMDDDLTFSAYDKSSGELVASSSRKYPRLFESAVSGLLNDDSVICGFANRFMCQDAIAANGLRSATGLPFCAVAFSRNRPLDLQFKTFFFTDISIPLQIRSRGLQVSTSYRLVYSLRSNRTLSTTATTKYREDDIVLYSAISMAQLFPGRIFGLKNTGNSGGGWSLQKSLTPGEPTARSIDKWRNFLTDVSRQQGFKGVLPPLVDIRTFQGTRDELFQLYRRNLKRAKEGAGVSLSDVLEMKYD